MKHLLAALCLGAVASFAAHAEIAQKFGDVEIHYNALSTEDLLPEVARSYKIERSKTRGILTLSILKRNKLGALNPVPGKLAVYLVNPQQQLANIDMREVREGTAIYYLGEFRVTPPETLNFTASVEVEAEPKREIKFKQKFYK
ncbi:MAG: DUF4426 domain-containing protein [Gammaproteobacteria bacterium]